MDYPSVRRRSHRCHADIETNGQQYLETYGDILGATKRQLFTTTRSKLLLISRLSQQVYTLFNTLKYCHTIRWRRDGSWVIQWAGRHKESPPVQFLAQLSQSFQVKHFSNWHSPARETIVVHRPVSISRRPNLNNIH
jgi:hypothetical protein